MAAGGAPPRADELRLLIESRDERDAAQKLQAHGGVDGLVRKLNSQPHDGLPSDQAAQKNKELYGVNKLPMKPIKSFFRLWLLALNDKTLIILMVAAVVNIALGMSTESVKTGWIEGTAILLAVLVVSLVTSINDYSKERQFRELNKVVADRKVSVVRGGRRTRIPIADVVVGDVVILETGDSIPADGIVITASELHVDESSMTGESEAVEKDPQRNIFLLANCKITTGGGTMLVLAVGQSSQWGRIKAMLDTPVEDTPLQEKLAALAERIGFLGLGAASLIFFILLCIWAVHLFVLERTPWEWRYLLQVNQFFLAGVSLIVIAVPEGLPLAVTMALAYSMRRMMKDNNLVRRLEACETMGGATNICSDKTGTLTENRMTVVRMLVAGNSFDVQPPAAAAAGAQQKAQNPNFGEALATLLWEAVAVNSSAFLQIDEQTKREEVIGNKTEGALLVLIRAQGGDYDAIRKRSKVLRTYPFSSDSKRMGTVVATPGGARFHCKGAAEIVAGFCTKMLDAKGTAPVPLDQSMLAQAIQQFVAQGLRCICLAYRDLSASQSNLEKAPEQDLVLLALVGIKDPVRADVPHAVRVCQRAGVTVRMLTGDNKFTAAHIAQECGIISNQEASIAAGEIIEGPQFRALSDADVQPLLSKLRVLARASPQDKFKLVKALREAGEVVAVTGDGTNDAPQLKEADVGFSMGIAGTEVAKEASDIVLLDDNFSSIVNAIKWGRNVYDSIRKFLQFQLTATVVAIGIAMVGSITAQQSPLTPIQMLWVNLVMDTFASLALATESPTEKLLDRLPYGRDDPIITRKMWRFIIGNSIFQLGVVWFLLFGAQLIPWLGLPADKDTWTSQDALTHTTLIFTAFVCAQLFNLMQARKLEDELNIFSGLFLLSNWLFWAVLGMSALGQFLLVQFGGSAVETTPLNGVQWLTCIGIGLLVLPWGFLLRLIPINNVVAPRHIAMEKDLEALGESEALISRPRKSSSLYEIRAQNRQQMSSQDRARSLWHTAVTRVSVVNTIRRYRR